MTPHFYPPTLAVLRHAARRNVSFPVQALGSIDVRQTSKMAVATEFSKSAPYLYLVNRVRKCKKKYLITLNGRQEYEVLR